MTVSIPRIRLLLRSVYLKGHQDGNEKKGDMSWEDKIVADIRSLIKEEAEKLAYTTIEAWSNTEWIRKADLNKMVDEVMK